jgi:hypothetical protein
MERYIESAFDILLPVMESSVVLAGEYAKKCNRDCLTATDLKYAMRYCARNLTGKHIGTLFPDDDSDDDSGSEVEETQDEPEFTRYQGDDEFMLRVNEAHDTWDDWIPTNPMETILKKSIDLKTNEV